MSSPQTDSSASIIRSAHPSASDQHFYTPYYEDAPIIAVIGSGFAGVDLVRSMAKSRVNIILMDRNNYHTFQPLLYQVATGGLEAGSIAYPIRKLVSGYPNVSFRCCEVTEVRPESNLVFTKQGTYHFDYLVLATGARAQFFGNRSAEHFSLQLKTVPQALDMRSAILSNLEAAVTALPEERERLTTFVIAGAGPTGVELAGSLAELRRVVIPSDYPELVGKPFRIILLDGADRVLPIMSQRSSKRALRYLEKMGVEVKLKTLVKTFDGASVGLSTGEVLNTYYLVWSAGVQGSPVEGLGEGQVEPRSQRIHVNDFNQVNGYENVFAIGDIALATSEKFPRGYPMVAPAAKQQGAHLAKNMKRLLNGKPLLPFKYADKGALAVVGRNKAVADFGKLSLSGVVAWSLWMFVHVLFLVGFRNKLLTLFEWSWNYFTFDRTVRLIVRPVEHPKQMYSNDPDESRRNLKAA